MGPWNPIWAVSGDAWYVILPIPMWAQDAPNSWELRLTIFLFCEIRDRDFEAWCQKMEMTQDPLMKDEEE